MNLVLLAAGKGTRFYPLTKTLPKALVPILGKPLIEYVLKPYLPFISKIICVVNSDTGHALQDFLGSSYNGVSVSCVVQDKTEFSGTMHALMSSFPYLDPTRDAFLVANSDDLFDPRELEALLSTTTRSPGIGVTRAIMPPAYRGIGVVSQNITGWTPREHGQETWCSNGFHILTRKVFGFMPEKIVGGELGLPQTLFSRLHDYPLRAFIIRSWCTVNGPEDVPGAERFITQHYS